MTVDLLPLPSGEGRGEGCPIFIAERRHRDRPEAIIETLQEATRSAVQALRSATHPIWGGPGWKAYLNSREDIERTIAYFEQNPIKARLAPQLWPFVRKYDGRLPGQALRPDELKKYRHRANDRRKR